MAQGIFGIITMAAIALGMMAIAMGVFALVHEDWPQATAWFAGATSLIVYEISLRLGTRP